MGTTAYGGRGSKGRAPKGDAPPAAQHTTATCQNPPAAPATAAADQGRGPTHTRNGSNAHRPHGRPDIDDPAHSAKGRRPGPRQETNEVRNVTQGAGGVWHKASVSGRLPLAAPLATAHSDPLWVRAGAAGGGRLYCSFVSSALVRVRRDDSGLHSFAETKFASKVPNGILPPSAVHIFVRKRPLFGYEEKRGEFDVVKVCVRTDAAAERRAGTVRIVRGDGRSHSDLW